MWGKINFLYREYYEWSNSMTELERRETWRRVMWKRVAGGERANRLFCSRYIREKRCRMGMCAFCFIDRSCNRTFGRYVIFIIWFRNRYIYCFYTGACENSTSERGNSACDSSLYFDGSNARDNKRICYAGNRCVCSSGRTDHWFVYVDVSGIY